ncbi:Fic/DOC family protein [Pleomorphochaeta sp. DL1XJH-081]|uniref:Fic/DOC family protein n=1 Tax=Pleomorphochaeta sp. DL1XJH-081 TaxID=3409690 RepID=UPI003BB79B2A
MKESHLRRHLDFICFVMETESYPVSDKTEQIIRDVLDEEVTGDVAINNIMDSYGLVKEDGGEKTSDGCYPGTEVYINYFGIKDQDLLDSVETEIVAVRMAEILMGPQEWKFDFDHLKTLHARLFDDIYPFAGMVRYIPITRSTIFCLPQYISSVAQDIFNKLRDEHYLRNQELDEFVDNLAYFMAEVHALHPFLDGNTRTMRLFFQQLSHAAGWRINPSDTSDSRLLEADIASLEGDYQPLISLLHEAVEPL